MKFLAAIAALALGASAVEAGLYNPAEPWEKMLNPLPGRATSPRPFDFLVKLFELRTLAQDGLPENPMRLRYSLVAELSPRLPPSTWPIDRKISLSAYLIRRGKHKEAIDLLQPLSRVRSNFLVLSNLATAYQLDTETGRAVDCLDQAWPRSWADVGKDMKTLLEQIGWTEQTFLWYRDAETYHLKLLKLRAREALGRAKGAGTPETLDNLFDVDFSYEGDKLPEKAKNKLPANALPIVQQLVIWLPGDPRLYWLLGELYHAQDTPEDVAAARQVFDDLAGFNGWFQVGGVKDHLRILNSATRGRPNMPVPETPIVPAPPVDDVKAVLDARPLLIGFAAGVVVSFLAYWQIREMRRRRMSRIPPN